MPDKFFGKGLQMLVDGADETKPTQQLNVGKSTEMRHQTNQGFVKA